MTRVDVIGGVYGERCAFPHWDEVYGSAGRAAIGLSSLVSDVHLHTMLPDSDASRISPNFEAYGVTTHFHKGSQFIGFEYIDSMADPVIVPAIPRIERQSQISVEAEHAVLFGMMECQPKVEAEFCVYDPQSPLAPIPFKETGSKAKHLAIVANAYEIARMTGADEESMAQQLLSEEDAEVVVVKRGLHGASVLDRSGNSAHVPAFKTENVFSIGSGDVFVAAFSYAWAIETASPERAVEFASKAAAHYVESSALPILSMEDASRETRDPVKLKGGLVYLAGPFRELGQRIIVNEARRRLRELGMDVFSPVHDIGHGPAEKVVAKDLAALDDCDAVLAILNGSSPGTLFEVGYARAKGKPVYCVAQNMRDGDMKLPHGSGCIVHRDFVSALHLLAWRE